MCVSYPANQIFCPSIVGCASRKSQGSLRATSSTTCASPDAALRGVTLFLRNTKTGPRQGIRPDRDGIQDLIRLYKKEALAQEEDLLCVQELGLLLVQQVGLLLVQEDGLPPVQQALK